MNFEQILYSRRKEKQKIFRKVKHFQTLAILVNLDHLVIHV